MVKSPMKSWFIHLLVIFLMGGVNCESAKTHVEITRPAKRDPEITEPAGRAAEIKQLRATLLEVTDGGRYRLSVPSDDPRLQPIERLSVIGSPDAIGVLEEFLTTYGAHRKLKQHTLVALGRIGTEAAMEAIRKFEKWTEKMWLDPPDFRFGLKDHAIDHFRPHELKPLATCQDENRAEWAIFRWHRLGREDYWITKAKGESTWSDPILLGNLSSRFTTSRDAKFDLRIEEQTFVVRVAGKSVRFNSEDYTLDSDGDGLPDSVERCLTTSAQNPDTDGDGVLDGEDGNPLTPKHKLTNDIAEIRQAVFAILFATCNSQDIVCVVEKGEFANQEYYGYGGFVLKSAEVTPGAVNITELTVQIDSPTAATATITDWEGNLAASERKIQLKKIHGKWVVVDFRMMGIA